MRFTDLWLGFLLAAAFAMGVGYALGVFQPSFANAGDDDASSATQSRWYGGWSHASYGRGGWGWCGEGRESKLNEMLEHAQHKLAITPAQRPRWDDFAAAVKAGETDLRGACATAASADGGADAPKRLAQFETMMAAGLKALKRVRPAFDALYAGLDGEQRETLDSLFSRRHRW
jgi:hypothetical protein